MRSVRWFGLVLLCLFLAACQNTPPVVPTAAQLPSPTPAPVEATEEAFFTATPGEAIPGGEITPGGADAPTAESGATAEAFASPTPEGEASLGTQTAAVATGPCSEGELRGILETLDLNVLRADLDAYMERLRGAAGTLDGWTLDATPDPLLGMISEGNLPLAQLRYSRDNGQEAFLLVSPAPEAVGNFLRECVASETFFRKSDVPAEAIIAIQSLDIGDQGAMATITLPTSPEIAQAGTGNMTTTVAVIVVGDHVVQYITSTPAAGTPVPQEDALALVRALVEVMQAL